MKNNRNPFQKKLLKNIMLLFVIIIAIMMFYMFLSAPWLHYRLKAGVYVMIVVVTVLMLGFVAYWFRRFIFKPVRTLEKTLEMLEEASDGQFIDLDVNVETLADGLTTVFSRLQESITREHEEIVLRQQSRYAELQSQINPHFLYNTLESIRGQAMIDDNYKIADMTEALAKYFRYNISKDNDHVTLSAELDSIRNYIRIQQYRFEDRFLFNIYNHDESLESLRCKIPKMTLQPIVENAIFHGMENKIEQGHISIHVETTEERLILIIADDGAGMGEETLQKLNDKINDKQIIQEAAGSSHNGIAMTNVNNRIKLLFGAQYGIHVSSTLGVGTEVEVTIPKIPYVQEDQVSL